MRRHWRTAALVSGFLCLMLGGFCAGYFGFTSVPSWVSAFAVVLIGLPSLVLFARQVGPMKAIRILLVMSLFAFGIEAFGIRSGFPYGAFSYADLMGPRLLGLVPWALPFAWIPFIFTATGLAQRVVSHVPSRLRMVRAASFAAVFLVLMDLVLDPAAVYAGLWAYRFPGAYYGVPWTNFAGWALSGFIGTMILMAMLGEKPKSLSAGSMLSGMGILWFWTGFSLSRGLFFPVFLSLIFTGWFGFVL